MPSLPTSPTPDYPDVADLVTLVHMLDTVPDPRKRRGVRYGFAGLLAVAIAAVVAGSRSLSAIGQWAEESTPELLSSLGLTRERPPSESAIRRALGVLDTDVFDRVMGSWMWTRTHHAAGRRVIAIDGKTVRGARTKDRQAPHLVAALDHTTGVVLGQLAVDGKSNEIPVVRDLLNLFTPAVLAGTVVTVDAMHTQSDTAKAITDAGADYVFTVKGNQPLLQKACKRLPWKDVPAHRATTTDRGRRITRTIKVVTAPAWVSFAAAKQVAQIRRTTTTGGGKKRVEVVYVITSADHQAAPPATLASWVQGHWSIENRLHWIRDVTYDEDRSQVRTGNTPRAMASLRNIAISLLRLTGATNIAAACRYHARHPENTLKTLLTS